MPSGTPRNHPSAHHQVVGRVRQKGLRKPIRGFLFHVDTGTAKPVCCKPPRYGKYEEEIILRLCQALKDNDMVVHDDGPWGALIVLAAKPGQENVAWWDFIWRLCVSYRPLNRITRPFRFPFRRCDDAVINIGQGRFRISIDMDSGYWQIPVELRSQAKLAFFGVREKLTWVKMPMGTLNAAPVFCAMMEPLKRKWDALALERQLTDFGSEVIMDDIQLFALLLSVLLQYFECVLEILQFHCATLKLRKCRFLGEIQEFVGVDVRTPGNSPASSKHAAFRAISRPRTLTDLRSLIGMFGFYAMWLPLFELRILSWRRVLMSGPSPSQKHLGNKAPVGDKWTPQCEQTSRS